MDREQRKVLDELIVWLDDESKKCLFPRTHNLHLTDWEVHWLLNALRGAPHVTPDYTFGSVGAPTMNDLEVRDPREDWDRR